MSTQAADFPDFFRGAQQANTLPLVDEHNVQHSNVTVQYGPFNVTEWQSLVIYGVSADFITVSLNWYGDAALTQVIGAQTLEGTAGAAVSDVVPVMGPYVQANVNYHTGAGTVAASLQISARTGGRDWPANLPNLIVARGTGINVNAGATNLIVAQLATSGQASFTVDTDAVSWVGIVNVLDFTGAVQGPACKIEHAAIGQACTARLQLPPWTCRIQLTNNDAAAKTFAYTLVVDRH